MRECTAEIDLSAAIKEDSSAVITQFLSAHATLEQTWCDHWKGGFNRIQDAAMGALETALIAHSTAASRLQENMQVFDPTMVVSLQTS